ncbi:hypothetical protein THTE_2456 [Thermogutta terrifontis]|uniref:Uncharacterized protein n=1 Tax=Thermogutta terrifontis TaxID=1331910 RepID=A0A286RGG6_9BACT|nr:hypothetical protein THTE_2456 [Thermogutta terrifontis]
MLSRLGTKAVFCQNAVAQQKESAKEIGRAGGGQRGRSSKEVGYAFILYAAISGRFDN